MRRRCKQDDKDQDAKPLEKPNEEAPSRGSSLED
jgi:hypothetical protein